MSERNDCPGFIDLGAFLQTVPEALRVAGSDPFAQNRALLALRGGPVEVGAIRLPAGSGETRIEGADEFVLVRAGSLCVTTPQGDVRIGAGESLLAERGAVLRWGCEVPTDLLFMRYLGAAEGRGRVIPIDNAVELVPSGAPAADLLVGPTPSCRNHTTWLADDGQFMAGVWDSTPYHRRAMPYRHFELMHLLAGSVTFVDAAGRSGTFRKGDSFLIEQHAQCSWESREHAAKIFAIYRPAA